LAMGGGLTLLAVMGMFLPVSVLVPVHGLVQLGSNTGRAVALKNDIEWGTLGPFCCLDRLGQAASHCCKIALVGRFWWLCHQRADYVSRRYRSARGCAVFQTL
ncbi:MAG: hypothetical protein AAFU69_06480, partial [Pseudomonadota bacterium]